MLDTQFNGSTSEIGRDFMKFFESHHNMMNKFARMKKATRATMRSSKMMTCPECQARIKLAKGPIKKKRYTSQHPGLIP